MSLATQILAMLALVVFVLTIIVSHIMSSRGSLQPLDTGMHHIRSILFSLPLSKLHVLYNSCLVNNVTNPHSNECKRIAIVLDIIFQTSWY